MTLKNYRSNRPSNLKSFCFFEDVAILERAVTQCAQEMFKVLATKIVWSSKRLSGRMDFKFLSGEYRNYSTGHLGLTYRVMQTITIHCDSTSYSKSLLGGALGQYKPHGKGTGLHYFYNSVIKKYQYSNITYISNDLAPNDIPATVNGATAYWDVYRAIQIHETGNALAELTGIYYSDRSDAYWINSQNNTAYAFSNAANLELIRQSKDQTGQSEYRKKNVRNIDSGNIDTDSGQFFELNVMKKYRQFTGYPS